MRITRTLVFSVVVLGLVRALGPGSVADAQFLPYYREATCGANCLYAVCLLKSIKTDLKEVYGLVEMTERGSSMLNLMKAAEKLGLHPQPWKTTTKRLREADAYAILHLKQNHFVLCVGWRGDDLVIVDPPKDAYLMTEKDLESQWTGYALLFERGVQSNEERRAGKSSGAGDAPRQDLTVHPAEADDKHMPEIVRALLRGIARQRSSRDELRGLYKMLNRPAPKIQPESWLNGMPMSIEELRGRIIILEFWSIDCGACLGEIENLNRLYEWSRSVPVTLITIHSYTDDITQVNDLIGKRGILYPVCIDSKGSELSDGRSFERYGVHGVPRRLIIDMHGRIRSIDTVVGPTAEDLLKESADGEQHTTSYSLTEVFGVKVSPSRIVFGEFSPGHTRQKSVYMYKPDDPDFMVNIESAPNAPAGVQLFRWEQDGTLLYELRVSLEASFPDESYSSEITATTNDVRTSHVAIPITGAKARQ